MIKIYTYFHKRPDFADIQIRSLRKYLKEDFELLVFNNAKFDRDTTNYNEINNICNELGVKITDIEKDQAMMNFYLEYEKVIGNKIFSDDGSYLNPNVAVAYSLCYIWEKFMCKENGKVAFLQHDMFLKEPVSFTEYMQDNELCYMPQSRMRENGVPINYMWNTFFLADLSKLPMPETMSWWCGSVDGIHVDVGGQTYKYLDDNPEVKTCIIPHKEFGEFGSQKIELGDKSLIHYYRGSNWDRMSDDWHKRKTEWLLKTLNL